MDKKDKLPKKIRSLRKRYFRYQSKYLEQLKELEDQCKHEKVVILHSEYSGSYSMDYDDWLDEVRICLVCGMRESGNKKKPHKILLNPIKRFELTTLKSIKETPLHSPTDVSLEPLLEWVSYNGYKV